MKNVDDLRTKKESSEFFFTLIVDS